MTITVVPVNDAPRATNQAASTAEDVATAITLAATDAEGDALTYAVVTPPLHGTLSGTPPALTYTPSANYNGPDSFTFRANDGALNSNVGTVSITVTAVNDAPVAQPQSVVLDEDTPKAVTLIAADVEGAALTYAIVSAPAHGALSGTPPALTYTPSPNYNGADSFTFVASDGSLQSNLATVSITVTPVDEPPPSPLAVDLTVSADGSGTVSTEPFSTAEPGEWLVAFVATDGPTSGGQQVTVSGAGLSWTLVKRANTQLGSSEIWRALAGSPIVNGVVSSSQTLGSVSPVDHRRRVQGRGRRGRECHGRGCDGSAIGFAGADAERIVRLRRGQRLGWRARASARPQPDHGASVDRHERGRHVLGAGARCDGHGRRPGHVERYLSDQPSMEFRRGRNPAGGAGPPPTISCAITAPAAGTNLFGIVTRLGARARARQASPAYEFKMDGSNLGVGDPESAGQGERQLG